MLTIALGAFTWIKSNIKWIVIGLCVIMASITLNKLYNMVLENGQYRIHVEEQQKTIANKDNIIRKLEQDKLDVQIILMDRDAKVKELELQMDGITVDLGSDANDQAPEAIKEFFRRLNKRYVK
jgi:hypothetical protein